MKWLLALFFYRIHVSFQIKKHALNYFQELYRSQESKYPLPIIIQYQIFYLGRDSAVGMCDSLRAVRSGDRIPVGARFSTHVQTCRGAYPASYTMGNGSFLGIKGSGRGLDHRPLSCSEVKERVELYLYSASGPSRPVLGRTFTLLRLLFCFISLAFVSVDSQKDSG